MITIELILVLMLITSIILACVSTSPPQEAVFTILSVFFIVASLLHGSFMGGTYQEYSTALNIIEDKGPEYNYFCKHMNDLPFQMKMEMFSNIKSTTDAYTKMEKDMDSWYFDDMVPERFRYVSPLVPCEELQAEKAQND